MLSVVITATSDDAKGLYLTYFAARQQLANVEHEFILVADGGSEWKWESQPNTRCLRVNSGSPQGSRDAGIRAAKFPNVLLLESHVIVSDIQLLLAQHRGMGAALTFPRRVAEGTEMFDVYGHETNWDTNLWHKRLVYRLVNEWPYRVSQFGQSCFMLDRYWYLDSGGYTNLMQGWGGEEPFICLKAWMLGRELWLAPHVWHAHFLTAGAHNGVSLGSDFVRNFDILAYVIAGRRQNGFVPSAEVEAERQKICAGPFKGDINLLREHLEKIGAVS